MSKKERQLNISFTKKGKKTFFGLRTEIREGFLKKVQILQENNPAEGWSYKWIKSLTGVKSVWRIRQGRYRLIFSYHQKSHLIEIEVCFLKKAGNQYERILKALLAWVMWFGP